GRHERAEHRGLAPEGREIRRGEAEAEHAHALHLAPPCPDAGREQAPHHEPEWAGVEVFEVDDVELHQRIVAFGRLEFVRELPVGSISVSGQEMLGSAPKARKTIGNVRWANCKFTNFRPAATILAS